MKTVKIGGATLSVFFDTRRQKMNQMYPVKYRVTFRRRRSYFPSGVDLTKCQWESLSEATDTEVLQKREMLLSGYQKMVNLITRINNEENFSLKRLSQRVDKRSIETVLNAFNRKIRLLEETGKTATASTYECTAKSILKFSGKDFDLTEIDPGWLTQYQSVLLNEGKSVNTVKFYIGCIRSVMNTARSENRISESQYPFGKGKFEIKTTTGKKPALTISQVSDIMNIQLKSDSEMRSRDLWLFSYLTNGIRFNDMLRIRYKDIAFGEIHFSSKRRNGELDELKVVKAPLLPEMREILNKWGNPDRRPESYIFPFLNDSLDEVTARKTIQNVIRFTNKKMAEISKMLNISTVSTSSARHSYAAVSRRSGVNVAFISEALGHSDIRTTENYLASLEQEERVKNAVKLTTFKSWYD